MSIDILPLRRRVNTALLPLAATLLASSCSHQSTEPAASPGPAASSSSGVPAASGALRKVGLLVTGPVSDGGWNEIAWKGCQWIKQKLGADINNQLVTQPQQFETSFQGYAVDGYDLVFGHGAEFSDAAMRVGPRFPKTRFVVTGGTAHGSNVSHIKLAMEEGTY